MKLLKIILISLLVFRNDFLFAQTEGGIKPSRVLILLDASSSMTQSWNDSLTRFNAATKIINVFIDSISKQNAQTILGLRVLGHQYSAKENNCFDSQLEVMFSKDNTAQIKLRLDALQPYGVSPIVYALRKACLNDLISPNEYQNSIILFTDGGESCGGDLCALKSELLAKGINVSVIGLISDKQLMQQYNCIGSFSAATKENDINGVIKNVVAQCLKPALSSSSQGTHEGFGYVQITNKNRTRNMHLYFELNNRYVLFDKLNIDALYNGQKLQLKSGNYKIQYENIRYRKSKNLSREFNIKTDQTTQIELN